MPGLIDLARKDPLTTNVGGTDVFNAQGTGYDAETRTVGSDELVQNQVRKIVADDSPLLQQARTASDQQMNRRGLVNSSIASTGALDAVLKSALPIAQQDANTVSTASRENMAAKNAAGQYNAGASNQVNLTNAAAANNVGGMKLGAEIETELIGTRTDAQSRLQTEQAGLAATEQRQREAAELAKLGKSGEIETGLQNLKGQQAVDLANIEAANKTLLQSSADAGKLYQQTLDTINKILLNTELSPEAKQAAIDQQNALLRQGLGVIGKINDLNISQLLNFSSAEPLERASAVQSQNAQGATAGTSKAATAYLNDARLIAEVNAARAALKTSGKTGQAALDDPKFNAAYYALNEKLNRIYPGNNFSLMSDLAE